MTPIKIKVNGKSVELVVDDPDMPLLCLLRNDLGFNAAFDATGIRLRSVPMTPAKVLAAFSQAASRSFEK